MSSRASCSPLLAPITKRSAPCVHRSASTFPRIIRYYNFILTKDKARSMTSQCWSILSGKWFKVCVICRLRKFPTTGGQPDLGTLSSPAIRYYRNTQTKVGDHRMFLSRPMYQHLFCCTFATFATPIAICLILLDVHCRSVDTQLTLWQALCPTSAPQKTPITRRQKLHKSINCSSLLLLILPHYISEKDVVRVHLDTQITITMSPLENLSRIACNCP